MFNLREGFTPANDMLPARLFTPLENGPLAGKCISKDDFVRALQTLYHLKIGTSRPVFLLLESYTNLIFPGQVNIFRMIKIRIHFGGHLAFYHPQKQNWLDRELVSPVSLYQVIEQLGIPPGEIAFSVVNDNIADPHNTIVTNNDTVQFYPPLDGG